MAIKGITTKVCIIGAGSAGLLIANLLQQNDIPCIVLEKCSQSEIYERFHPVLLDYQTVSILKDHNLGDRLLAEGTPHGQCEFRTPQQSFVLDYAQKCQGQTHYAYPQNELLMDLSQKFEQAGGEILFNTQAIKITNNQHGAWIKCQQHGQTIVISCDFIAGCDGEEGISRTSIPETITKTRGKNFDYSWLAIAAEAPTSSEHIIYALHPHGFAGHMLHHEKISNYYLQIPLEDTVADWSDERIWSELCLRLASNGWKLKEGKIIAKQILKMNSSTPQTMQHSRLFLAGDVAHVMTPAGDKGINLAIQDADVLGKSWISFYQNQDNLPLKNYSEQRLPVVRQIQQFSESWLYMLNIQDKNSSLGKSQQRVQQFKRSQLMNSEIYALDFARKYVQYNPSSNSRLKLVSLKNQTNFVNFNNLADLPPLQVG
jgi:p-hydroxybenzoate 3-monooxygenase